MGSAMTALRAAAPTLAAEADDKDRPLRDDIRLLGRLLGDTVREQEGQSTFDLVERIRQTSIRFHRDGDAAARRELEAILDGMSADQTVKIVRAFSYFSHLANIAEDQHHIRRNRAHLAAGSAPRAGSLKRAFARAKAAGVAPAALRAFFAGAHMRPVLTAHPTEVRRKSTITREMEVASLLDARERCVTAEQVEENDSKLRVAILTLWQTTLLRLTKPTVLDEVANGISYYDHTFLREVPEVHCAVEDELDRIDPAGAGTPMPSFLRIGSWIGGDRDGNPFVTAAVLRETMRLQSSRILRHYLDELHELGGELSLSGPTLRVSPDLSALADSSPDRSPRREHEPYRRAISGLYARMAATAVALDHMEAPRHPAGDAPPYATPADFAADLATIAASLEANGARILARARLRRLRRAVDCFGFHLATLDLR
ncbi:MAG: phosphoenolpyruvate carboxylase, partial [Hyphomicrobiales bacterium]|nr:phosphoenolpyruvate carboxylase [Hyphomicrobiales bacterium]